MNDVLKAIHDRRTVRDFKPDQITDEELATILEAGHQAASAWNRQPWYFTVVQKKSLLDRIVDSARDTLPASFPDQVKEMPWIVAPGFHYYYNAPTVIIISGQMSNDNVHGDCSIAMINMVYAANSIGIQGCMVTTANAAFESEAGSGFLKELEIPAGYTPLYSLVLGYTSKPLPTAAPRKEDYVNYIK